MKNRSLFAVVIFMISLLSANAQDNQTKLSPAGDWKFEAPYAPEGFTTGLINIGLTDNKQTASISFNGSEYKIQGENVKVSGDTVTFKVYLEGQDISIRLIMENDAKMSGKATYIEGEIPLTLTKQVSTAK